MIVFRTERLVLMPCSPGDRDDFVELEGDPEVMRFLNGGRAVEDAAADGSFLMPRGTEDHVWTARRKANGAFVGWFCLWPDGERAAELGYRLRRADWGRGLAPEGAAALINWGFGSGGYDRIFASTMTTNRASRRVLEKIGMGYVRTFHPGWHRPFPGTELGEVEYELLNPAAAGR